MKRVCAEEVRGSGVVGGLEQIEGVERLQVRIEIGF
jgi:hypothetical protein